MKVDWENWEPKERSTLMFICEDEQVLLIHKKRGLGEGKINAPGGKLDEGETPLEAALRETKEEVGMNVSDAEFKGELRFQFKDGHSIHCSVFLATSYKGKPRETDEATPFWCPVGEIPYERMWEDDRFWLPKMLKGNFFKGWFSFDNDKMLDKRLEFSKKAFDSEEETARKAPGKKKAEKKKKGRKGSKKAEAGKRKNDVEADPEATEDEEAALKQVDAEIAEAVEQGQQGQQADGAEEAEADAKEESEDKSGKKDKAAKKKSKTKGTKKGKKEAAKEKVIPMPEGLPAIVESLLIASESPMSSRAIAKTLKKAAADQESLAEDDPLRKITDDHIAESLDVLNEAYDATGRAFTVVERSTGWKIYTKADFAPWVRTLFPEQKPARMSPPALETLAIIAYRQPLTKADIEAVRGVSIDGVIKVLLDRNLVHISGRAEVPGRPLLYGTTELFLEHFGIKDLEELPNSSELRQVQLPTADYPEQEGGDQPPDDGDPGPESAPSENSDPPAGEEDAAQSPDEEAPPAEEAGEPDPPAGDGGAEGPEEANSGEHCLGAEGESPPGDEGEKTNENPPGSAEA
ncbi:MAG: SMC-Scp complex subunit ScpB [Verrucomicrobiota bacterium]